MLLTSAITTRWRFNSICPPESPLDNLFVSVYRAFIIAQCHLCQGDLGKAGWYAEKTLRQAECYTGTQSTSGATLAPLLAEIAYECQRVTRPSIC
jgi:LuxR family maltose regulon positive regulatory protein